MKIVSKVLPDMDRKEILCTTYQMRNCFKQFADGVASELDVHCYFQHAYAADLAPSNAAVLDVCCGRGLMLPFLRYRGNQPRYYCGVDISSKNAVWQDGSDPRYGAGKIKTDWGFPRVFVESNVAEMAEPIKKVYKEPFDLIIYTSAIEHMQPDAQQASLHECMKLSHSSTYLYLTCPVTQAGTNGYNCQYAAHIYEPTEAEITKWLSNAGWSINRKIGISTSCTRFREILKDKALAAANTIMKLMPREQALPTIATLYPEAAAEMAFICSPTRK